MVAQGSIPWAGVGLIALFSVAIMPLISLFLTDRINDEKGGNNMERKTLLKDKLSNSIKLLGISLLETLWAIETSIAAGALPT